MTEYVEKWGDSIESAVELALKEMKLTKDEVEVTVLEQPSRGFFGIGKRLAKVRVEKKADESESKKYSNSEKLSEKTLKKDSEKPAEKYAEKSQKNHTEKHVENHEEKYVKENTNKNAGGAENKEKKKDKHAAKSEPAVHDDLTDSEKDLVQSDKNSDSQKKKSVVMNTKFSIAEEDTDAVLVENSPAALFIENIAQKMSIDVKAEAYSLDGVLYISLKGKEVGTLIGKRGQTLDAVQYLASIVQNKNADERMRVIVNAENYREKREKTLQSLANRLADKCIKYRKSVRLEPMNPYERKVIHSTLQNHKAVTTRSEGVEPNRRVVIELKK